MVLRLQIGKNPKFWVRVWFGFTDDKASVLFRLSTFKEFGSCRFEFCKCKVRVLFCSSRVGFGSGSCFFLLSGLGSVLGKTWVLVFVLDGLGSFPSLLETISLASPLRQNQHVTSTAHH